MPIRLEDLDVGKPLTGDEVPRVVQLQRVRVYPDHPAPRADPAREWPEQPQRAESEVEATPARHRAKQVKPRLGLKLPHPRLEAEPLKLGGGVGQQVVRLFSHDGDLHAHRRITLPGTAGSIAVRVPRLSGPGNMRSGS